MTKHVKPLTLTFCDVVLFVVSHIVIIVTVNPCSSNPCLNSGTCQALGDGSYQCTCSVGFSGQNCQSRLLLSYFDCHDALPFSLDVLYISKYKYRIKQRTSC